MRKTPSEDKQKSKSKEIDKWKNKINKALDTLTKTRKSYFKFTTEIDNTYNREHSFNVEVKWVQ